MYLINKYTRWYNLLIDNAKTRPSIDGYVERHHIQPRSLGGTDDPINIVSLTAREHFVCHWLLTKMVNDVDKNKMQFALACMTRKHKGMNGRIYTSLEYSTARRAAASAAAELTRNLWKDPHARGKRVESLKKATSTEEYKHRTSKIHKELAKTTPQEIIDERTRKAKITNLTPEGFAKRSQANSIAQQNPQVKAKKSQRMKEMWKDPEYRARRVNMCKERWKDPEYRDKMAEISKKAWNDEDSRKRRISNLSQPHKKNRI